MGFFSDIANGVSNFVDNAQDFVEDTVDAAQDMANDVVDGAQRVVEDAVDTAQHWMETGAEEADGAVEWLGERGAEAVETAGEWYEAGKAEAQKALDQLLDLSVEEIVEGVVNFANEVGDKAEALGHLAGEKLGEAGQYFQDMFNDVKNRVDNAGYQLVVWVQDGGEATKEKIRTTIGDVRDAAYGAARRIEQGLWEASMEAAETAEYLYTTDFGDMIEDLKETLRKA